MSKQPLPIYSICSLSHQPLSKSDFMTDRFDHYLETHKDLKFPHKHSFYHLVYFEEGSGHHSIDFKNFPVEAGQIYFMIPGQVHTWNFRNQPHGFIINFSAHYIHELVANTRFLEQFIFFSGIADEQVVRIPASEREGLTQLFELIKKEADSANDLKDDMIRSALVQLFISVNRLAARSIAPHTQYNSLLLRGFQKLIDLHYKDKKLTKDYAAMLFVTPNHLNALSKHVTGRPAGELIRDRVLLEAKRLLVNADLNISEIAADLNFDDNSYFSKFFKKYTGVTPEAFRKKIIEKS
jgi:AraC family transcriptional activator of pobA